MEIDIDLNKSVDENAGDYFDLSKKAKRKLEGAKKALFDSQKKLADLRKQEDKFWQEENLKQQKKERKKEWYEKFHWFISSENYLCIGGRDATSNEIIIKKHVEKDDLVFHTDMAGSPFFVVKNGQKAGEKTLQEVANATAMYSRAWKLGYVTAGVFYVLPDQVSKEAPSGEYMVKGSFMIRGKTTYVPVKMECALGLLGEQVIAGPPSAIEAQTKNVIVLIPGDEKKSDLAKKIKRQLKGGELDEIIAFLPAGDGKIKK